MSRLGQFRELLSDLRRGVASPEWRAAVAAEMGAMPHALTSTLPWLVRARDDADESWVKQVDLHAAEVPDALALEMHDERLTWRGLQDRASRTAFVLAAHGVRQGDVVALVGQNSPTYVALVLGIARLGATAALINHHLEGPPLVHAVRSSGARVAVVEARFAAALDAPEVRAVARDILVYGGSAGAEPGGSGLDALLAAAPARLYPRIAVPATHDFVYIYTSGTTGLPKPCKVSHARTVVAGSAFGNLLFELQPGDKLYSVLPLYHSSALMIGVGSAIMTRTPIALREHFSAREFWPDVQRYGATAILYIGELCRYLVQTPPQPAERGHSVRVALGNGLRADVWPEFVRRFGIPHVREFYSATEAPGAIFNLHDKVGSIGRVPFRAVSRLQLARFDVERDELVRDARGFCVRCQAGETGQLLIQLDDEPKSALSDFRGYTDPEATRRKILENAFEPGDRYFISGDLMRFDENDFFYFVDRIGDTYRWKGENVSTAEVGEALARAPGVREVTVVGVPVPGMEGQAGLAALAVEGEFDAAAFWRVASELPGYAQPRFVRLVERLATTGTFKIQKTELKRAGVDPGAVPDPLFLRTEEGYVPLTPALYADLGGGQLRL